MTTPPILHWAHWDPDAPGKAPVYATSGAAGLDLHAHSMNLQGSLVVYGTGISVAIPEGYAGLLIPRSSVVRTGLSLANSVGLIDSDFRGEILVCFRVVDPKLVEQAYRVGDRIAQLVVIQTPWVTLVQMDSLGDTERGTGGWGSTGGTGSAGR